MTQPLSTIYSPGYDVSGSSATKSKDMDKNQFLKLLTLQLKAQNPLKPLENQEFASQIAQFSQLEQLSDIRSLLEEQLNTYQLLAEQISNTQLPGMLGKNAKISGDSVFLSDNNTSQMGYNLPENANSGTLSIKDSSGKVVKTISLDGKNLETGFHKILWDGTNSDGDRLPNGNYSFSVKYTLGKGIENSAETFVYGRISAIRFKNEGTMLVINDSEYPLKSIVDINAD